MVKIGSRYAMNPVLFVHLVFLFRICTIGSSLITCHAARRTLRLRGWQRAGEGFVFAINCFSRLYGYSCQLSFKTLLQVENVLHIL